MIFSCFFNNFPDTKCEGTEWSGIHVWRCEGSFTYIASFENERSPKGCSVRDDSYIPVSDLRLAAKSLSYWEEQNPQQAITNKQIQAWQAC